MELATVIEITARHRNIFLGITVAARQEPIAVANEEVKSKELLGGEPVSEGLIEGEAGPEELYLK